MRAVKILTMTLLLSGAGPTLSQADTPTDVAGIVIESTQIVPPFLCDDQPFYRTCFGISAQQCHTDLTQIQPGCAGIAPVATLEQAFDAGNGGPFKSFGRDYMGCVITAHTQLPQYNQAAVMACLRQPPSQPPFRVETLIPIIQDILED